MKIKHEDVFKYFWKVEQTYAPDVMQIVYLKYSGYVPETKKYYFSTGQDGDINGVQLSFFQDKEYFLMPPE